MSDEKDDGIIINKYPFSETSLIVHWLTRNSGLIATVARGVFRYNSTFYGRIDLFYYANIEFKKSRKSELHSLKEVELIDSNSWIRENISALHKASYSALLMEKLIPKNTPTPHIFHLFLALLNCLKTDPNSPAPIVWFETKLLIDSGEFHLPTKHKLRENISNIVNLFIKSDSPETIKNIDRNKLNQIANYNLGSLSLNEQQQNLRLKAIGEIV
ncbi:MAG: DNA repair protein RecO [Verrucomicrobiia bacterium]|jgi:DNA repair protein RecO (recombination protein O)